MTDAEQIKIVVSNLINSKKIKNENELCVKLGFSSSNLGKIKSGQRKIPPALKLALIKHYDYDIDSKSKDQKLEKSVEEIGQKTESEENVSRGPSPALESEMVQFLTKYANNLLKVNEELTDSHKTYREIVEKCSKAGVLTVDLSKKISV